MTLPNPDELTVSELEDRIEKIDDPDVLTTIKTAERDGKDRTTAIDALDERLDEVDEDAEHEDEDGDAADEAETTTEPNHIRVRPAPNVGGGHIAGFSFSSGEVKIVPANGKVKKALRRGKLQRIA